jgi:hypothetical protein
MFDTNLFCCYEFQDCWHITHGMWLVYLWAMQPIVGNTATDALVADDHFTLMVHADCMLNSCVSNPPVRLKHAGAVQVCALRRPSVVQLAFSQP